MTKRTICECDRCGRVYDDGSDRDACGQVRAARLSGADVAGTEGEGGAADLCGDCMADLAAFMAGAVLALNVPPGQPKPKVEHKPRGRK